MAKPFTKKWDEKAKEVRGKVWEKVPTPIKKPIEQRYEGYKAKQSEIKKFEAQQRAVAPKQARTLKEIEARARYKEEMRQASLRGQERGAKGSLAGQIGKAFIKEATKPRTDSKGREMPEAIAHQFVAHPEPRNPNVVQRPEFAPAGVRDAKGRAFITPQSEPGGLSLGMQNAFFGREPAGSKTHSGVQRAFFGETMMAKGKRPAFQPARQTTAIERAFFGEPAPMVPTTTVQARKRMIRVKRKPMY